MIVAIENSGKITDKVLIRLTNGAEVEITEFDSGTLRIENMEEGSALCVYPISEGTLDIVPEG